jgi:hypothetical protein
LPHCFDIIAARDKRTQAEGAVLYARSSKIDGHVLLESCTNW